MNVDPSVDAFFPTRRFVHGKVEEMVNIPKRVDSMIFFIVDATQLFIFYYSVKIYYFVQFAQSVE